jgi:predicted Zn finger-like uncharacterized protein
MILTCPECATRYFVEDQRLGTEGRTVRCASCGAAWRACAEEPLELTSDEHEGALARGPNEPRSFAPTESSKIADLSAPELPKAFRAKAKQRKRLREAAAAGVVWAGLVCAFGAVTFGAYVFRIDVVKMFPRAAGAYAMAGVPVNPTGLEFENVKAAAAPNGLAAVTVSARIRNVDDQPSSPPPVRVSLLDKTGAKIGTKLVTLPPGALAPGQTKSFSVALGDPYGKTADVALNFALELAPKPVKKTQVAAKKAQVTQVKARLRPSVGVEAVMAEEATPLGASDPFALDGAAGKAAASAPHG